MVLRNNKEFKSSTLSKDFEINDAQAKQSFRLLQNKYIKLAAIRDEAKSKYKDTSLHLLTMN